MKYYAFMPFYHYSEIMDERQKELCDRMCGDYYLPTVVITNNHTIAINLYAETYCPASQLVVADSLEELYWKIDEMKDNFRNPDWVNEFEKQL